MNDEPTNTTTDRISPPKQIYNPVHIRIEDLESIRECELAKRRERIDEFKSRNW